MCGQFDMGAVVLGAAVFLVVNSIRCPAVLAAAEESTLPALGLIDLGFRLLVDGNRWRWACSADWPGRRTPGLPS